MEISKAHSYMLGLLFFMHVNVIIAQSNTKTIKIGSDYSIKNNMEWQNVIDVDKNSMITMSHSKTGKFFYINKPHFGLQKFNNELELVKSQEIDLKKNGVDITFKGILKTNTKLQLLSAQYNKQDKSKSLVIQELNKETVALNAIEKKLVTIEKRDGIDPNKSALLCDLNNDSTKILVTSIRRTKKMEEEYDFYMYDEKLNLVWDASAVFKNFDMGDGIYDLKVDNEGNIYALVVNYEDVLEKYTLYCIYDEATKIKEVKIDSKDYNFGFSMKLFLTDKQDVICTGVYSKDKAWTGNYFLKIEHEDRKVKVNKFTTFHENQVINSSKVNTKWGGYDFKDLIVSGDGSAYYLLESIYVGQSWTFYNTVTIIKANAEGEVDWITAIPKRQEVTGKNVMYASFDAVIYENQLYMFYSDTPENHQQKDALSAPAFLDKMEDVTFSDPSAFLSLKISPKGKISKKVLTFSERLGAKVPLVQYNLSYPGKYYYVTARSAGKKRMMKIDLNKL